MKEKHKFFFFHWSQRKALKKLLMRREPKKCFPDTGLFSYLDAIVVFSLQTDEFLSSSVESR